MPQIDLLSFFPLVIYVLLGFLSLVFLLRTYFLPNLSLILKMREKMGRKTLNKVNISPKVKQDIKPNYLNPVRDMVGIVKEHFNKLQK